MTVPQAKVAGRPFKNTVVQLALKAAGSTPTRYETQVSSCEFVPATTALNWSGGTEKAQLADQTAETYTANLTAVQAWEDSASFVNLCQDHGGERATLIYYPLDDVAVGFSVDLTLPRPRIGGPAGAYNDWQASVSCTPPVRVTTLPTAITPPA